MQVRHILENKGRDVITVASNATLEEVARIVAGRPWVWVGDGMVAPERVALSCPPNARPYLHALLPELLPAQPLLLRLGVRQSFGVSEIVRALRSLPRRMPPRLRLSGCAPPLPPLMLPPPPARRLQRRRKSS
jgi:hypothetical protein